MKGIILAGGKGTRLSPLTNTISKQLLPVYNKPMIYYPLNTLREMGIVDVLVITSDLVQCSLFREQLKDASKFGLNIEFAVQQTPRGLPDAFIIGERFIGDSEDVTLILGDNVFITNTPIKAQRNTIYTYKVKDPSHYGVVTINNQGYIQELIEKPSVIVSDDAVVGLYTFPRIAIEIAKQLTPSKRQEIEIVDLIKELDKLERINIQPLDGFWFDCGTHESLLECANLVKAVEQRTNKIIGLS